VRACPLLLKLGVLVGRFKFQLIQGASSLKPVLPKDQSPQSLSLLSFFLAAVMVHVDLLHSRFDIQHSHVVRLQRDSAFVLSHPFPAWSSMT